MEHDAAMGHRWFPAASRARKRSSAARSCDATPRAARHTFGPRGAVDARPVHALVGGAGAAVSTVHRTRTRAVTRVVADAVQKAPETRRAALPLVRGNRLASLERSANVGGARVPVVARRRPVRDALPDRVATVIAVTDDPVATDGVRGFEHAARGCSSRTARCRRTASCRRR